MFQIRSACRPCAPTYSLFLVTVGFRACAAELLTLPEHLRPDPIGRVVKVDRPAASVPRDSIVLEGARASFVSCHLLVTILSKGLTVATIEVRVLAATVPAENAVQMDHNTYGTSWLAGDYLRLSDGGNEFFTSDRFFGLIHAYHSSVRKSTTAIGRRHC